MYDYVLLGIFEKHKLIFSFQMTIMILDQWGKIIKEELDFFLKGNTSLDNIKSDNYIDWLNEF